jgi:hypothetical protein
MMQLINTIKGWFIMTENNLLVVCITLVIMSAVGSVSYYHVAQNEFMSRNIENGIVKGIDPVAVRCAYANSNDNVCVAYAAAKDHNSSPVNKK